MNQQLDTRTSYFDKIERFPNSLGNIATLLKCVALFGDEEANHLLDTGTLYSDKNVKFLEVL